MRKTTASIIALCLLVASLSANAQAHPAGLLRGGSDGSPWSADGLSVRDRDTISPELRSTLHAMPPDGLVTVIVTLRDRPNLSALDGHDRSSRKSATVRALQATAAASQRGLMDILRTRQASGQVARARSYWIFNGLAVTATSAVIDELSRRPEVRSIRPNSTIVAPAPGAMTAARELSPRMCCCANRGRQDQTVASSLTGSALNPTL